MAPQLQSLVERRMEHLYSRYVLPTCAKLQHTELNIHEQGHLADGGDMDRRYEQVGYKLLLWN